MRSGTGKKVLQEMISTDDDVSEKQVTHWV